MDERGQASIEFIGVVALMAALFAVVATVALSAPVAGALRDVACTRGHVLCDAEVGGAISARYTTFAGVGPCPGRHTIGDPCRRGPYVPRPSGGVTREGICKTLGVISLLPWGKPMTVVVRVAGAVRLVQC